MSLKQDILQCGIPGNEVLALNRWFFIQLVVCLIHLYIPESGAKYTQVPNICKANETMFNEFLLFARHLYRFVCVNSLNCHDHSMSCFKPSIYCGVAEAKKS